jgi:hypothetical protein
MITKIVIAIKAATRCFRQQNQFPSRFARRLSLFLRTIVSRSLASPKSPTIFIIAPDERV